MYHQEYPGSGISYTNSNGPNPNRITPSFKPEYGYTGYYQAIVGQSSQQLFAGMGYIFRDISEKPTPVESSLQFRPNFTERHNDSSWNQAGTRAGRRFVFRPLVDKTTAEQTAIYSRVKTRSQEPRVLYPLSGYAAELPGYTFVDPVFRPIPYK